eukprot:scaffold7040_cov256-Pinguiococcus_pyrenoidosus.AAC.2
MLRAELALAEIADFLMQRHGCLVHLQVVLIHAREAIQVLHERRFGADAVAKAEARAEDPSAFGGVQPQPETGRQRVRSVVLALPRRGGGLRLAAGADAAQLRNGFLVPSLRQLLLLLLLVHGEQLGTVALGDGQQLRQLRRVGRFGSLAELEHRFALPQRLGDLPLVLEGPGHGSPSADRTGVPHPELRVKDARGLLVAHERLVEASQETEREPHVVQRFGSDERLRPQTLPSNLQRFVVVVERLAVPPQL